MFKFESNQTISFRNLDRTSAHRYIEVYVTHTNKNLVKLDWVNNKIENI